MKILAVDTALAACSVAVLSGETVLARRHVPMERGHAEALAPMVEETLREAALSLAALDRLAVTTGPGTFTGQRVGLSFMRAMRVALERPLIGVTSLAAIAHQALAATDTELAAVVHEARHDAVYLEIVDSRGASQGPRLVDLADAAATIAGAAREKRTSIAGSAAPRILAHGASQGLALTHAGIVAPDAVWVARLAARAEPSEGPPRPLYLQEPAAKIPGKPK